MFYVVNELWRQTGQRPVQEKDKTMSLGLDWPHTEETRWTCSQESPRVEPTGEVQKRETPAHLEMHEDGRARGETPYMAGDKSCCTK